MATRTMWLCADGSVMMTWLSHDDRSAVPEDARFLMSCDGIPETERDAHRMEYCHEVASDPIDGWSATVGFRASSEMTEADRFQRRIPNHHSVTFDAQSSGSINSGTTITIAHTMSASANGYIGASQIGFAGLGPYTATFNAVSMISRLTVLATGGMDFSYYDLVAPASGSHNAVISQTGSGGMVAGVQSATGVDQATPRADAQTGTANDTSPTITLSSAVGGLGFTNVGFYTGGGVTDTPDATWTTDYNVKNSSSDFYLVGQHIAGAATVTRTDTLSAGTTWLMAGVALAAAATGGGPLIAGGELTKGALIRGGRLVT